MVSKRGVSDLAFSIFSILLLASSFVSSEDLSKNECADKLIGLSSCIPYVDGESKTPTIDCCSGLKVVLDKSKQCICFLIKDRNDPNLGIKLNATLAVQLPSACHTPVNITHCVDLLHLAPNSPDAKVFEGLENSTKANSSAPVSSGSVEKGPPSLSAQEKSNGGLGKKWLVAKVVCAILPFVFISHFFVLV